MTQEKRILVLDDDEDVRFLMEIYLKRMGFLVDFAVRGDEAVELYRSAFVSGERYSAAILDLNIVGSIGGRDVGQQILAFDGNAKLFVTSGNENDPVMVEYGRYGFAGSIAKPFRYDDAAELMKKIV